MDPVHATPPARPEVRVAPPPPVAATWLGVDQEAGSREAADRRSLVVTPQQRLRVEVEWHAASLSYVHRILDPATGRQITQFPAAQVLDLVDDLMRQIAQG